MKIDKYVKDLYNKIDRLPVNSPSSSSPAVNDNDSDSDNNYDYNSENESFESRFNIFVSEVMPHYKAEVMCVHNITSDEEYKRRVLEGDNSIYLPQPNDKFPPTMWDHRAAHAIGVDYQGLQDKIKKGEVKDKIGGQIEIQEDGKYGEMWCDEDPQALF